MCKTRKTEGHKHEVDRAWSAGGITSRSKPFRAAQIPHEVPSVAAQSLCSQNLVQLAAAAAAIIPLIRWTSSRMLSYNQIQTSVAPRRADLDERECDWRYDR
jgi:hypothetical protein